MSLDIINYLNYMDVMDKLDMQRSKQAIGGADLLNQKNTKKYSTQVLVPRKHQ